MPGNTAVGLYAVLAYDCGDFIDMALNAVGATIVTREIARRKAAL